MDKLKEAHDKLLAEKSAEDVHDEANCPFCNPTLTIDNSDERGEVKTFTEEEVNATVIAAVTAAVEAAVTPIQAELDSIKSAQTESEVDAQIAAAKAEADEAIATLQAELDVKVLEATEASNTLATTLAFLEAQKSEAEAAELADSRKDERLAAIKEVASFPEEHVAKHLDRWVAMDDEAFAELLETFALVSKPEAASEQKPVVAETAMSNIRKDASAGSAVSSIREIASARRAGVNIKTL